MLELDVGGVKVFGFSISVVTATASGLGYSLVCTNTGLYKTNFCY